MRKCWRSYKILYSEGANVCAQSGWTLATPWTVACQAPLTMGFPKQEH